MLLVTATVAIATFSCIAFVQGPVMSRTGRLGKFQMRGAAPEDIATDAPVPDARKSSSGPAVLGALAALGLLAGLLAPQSTTAFMDEVYPFSSKTSSTAAGNRSGAPTAQVQTEYVSISTKKKNDPQVSKFSQEFKDESSFLESASGKENDLQENAGALDFEAACYPGFC